MDYILQIIGAFLLVVLFTLHQETERKWKRFTNLLPGPKRLPIVGSLIHFFWYFTPGANFEKFDKLCQKYGPTLGFQAGIQYFIVTEDVETAKELMSSDIWHPRFPSHPMYKDVTFDQNIGVLTSAGPDWREIRKFTIKKLVDKGFGDLRTTDIFLAQEVDHLIREFDNYRNQHNNEIKIHQYFNICVFNVIWKFVAGSRFEHDDVQMRKILDLMERSNKLIDLGSNPVHALPFLRKLPGVRDFDEIKFCATQIHELFREIMIERRIHGNFKYAQNDFVDYFLQKIEEGKNDKDSIYTDEQFLQCGTDLLLAGSDTTSNSIEFTLLYLVKYPEVQAKLRAEIDSVVGRNRAPTVFDKPSMPYAEALVLEVLRVANVIPVNTRVSIRETKLNGYDVPEQTFALINLVKIHKSKELWGDPEEFRPERFLDENMNIVNKEKLFAFGSGKRVCIGLTMAKLTWFTFITTLVQRYTFEPSSNHPELSTTPDAGFANMPHPFYCIVKPRQ